MSQSVQVLDVTSDCVGGCVLGCGSLPSVCRHLCLLLHNSFPTSVPLKLSIRDPLAPFQVSNVYLSPFWVNCVWPHSGLAVCVGPHFHYGLSLCVRPHSGLALCVWPHSGLALCVWPHSGLALCV